MSSDDPYTQALAPLLSSGNWVALVRYWIAHCYEPALEAALDVLRKLGAGDERWRHVHDVAHALRHFQEFEGKAQAWRQLLDFYDEMGLRSGDIYKVVMFDTLNKFGIHEHKLNRPRSSRDSFEAALEIIRYSPTFQEENIASVLHNLGTLEHELLLHGPAKAHLEEALDIREKLVERFPAHLHEVAGTLSALGALLRDLIQYELALVILVRAETIYRDLKRWSELAMTLINLATVLRRCSNLSKARQKCTEALQLYQALDDKDRVASALLNLATIERELGQLGSAQQRYLAAADIYVKLAEHLPDVYNPLIGDVYHNLGNVQQERGGYESAIACFTAALHAYAQAASKYPGKYSYKIAMTLNGLGGAQRLNGDTTAARESLETAVKILEENPSAQLGALLAERQVVWFNLGELYRTDAGNGKPDYMAARQALRYAVHYAEEFRGHLKDRILRNTVHAKLLMSYESLVWTCADLWKVKGDPACLEEAVYVAEQSRSRSLMEKLGEEEFPPRNVSSERFAEFLLLRAKIELSKLAQDADQLGLSSTIFGSVDPEIIQLAKKAGSGASGSAIDELRACPPAGNQISWEDDEAPPNVPMEAPSAADDPEARFKALLEELQMADPEWDPDRPVKALPSEAIRKFIPTDVPTAFVQFTLAAKACLAMVITRETIVCVPLPALSEKVAAAAAREWLDAYYSRALHPNNWVDRMDARLSDVGVALRPLWSALENRGIQRAVLSPSRWLHVIPLHACLKGEGDQRVCDKFEITYTPSLSILGRCVSRERAANGTALIVGNPTHDLDFAQVEASLTEGHFPGASVLDPGKPQKSEILAKAPESWLFHYTGHTTFEVEDPMASSLVLESRERVHRAEWLSLRDAFGQLNLGKCSLAVLNGCESGMLIPNRADEYIALASGFLHAGAKCVLSTLWAVHDLPAALLMDRFYFERRSGKSVASALRDAGRWVREGIENGAQLLEHVRHVLLRGVSTKDPIYGPCIAQAEKYAKRAGNSAPFASPAHWAAFTAIGSAWHDQVQTSQLAGAKAEYVAQN